MKPWGAAMRRDDQEQDDGDDAPKRRRLFEGSGRDILRAQRATKLRRAAAPSGAAGAVGGKLRRVD
jgi:hypothetical protein